MVTLWATGDVITAARLNDYNCQSISIKPSTVGASAITIRDTGDTVDKIILREDGSATFTGGADIGASKLLTTSLAIWEGMDDRLFIRNRAADAFSVVLLMPRGSPVGTTAAINIFNTDFAADSVNFERLQIDARGTDYVLNVGKGGTGSLRPLKIRMDENDIITITTGLGIELNDRLVYSLKLGEPMDAGNNAINFVSSLRGTYGPASAIEFPAGTGGRISINTPDSVGAITERMVFQGLVDIGRIDIFNAYIDMNDSDVYNVASILGRETGAMYLTAGTGQSLILQTRNAAGTATDRLRITGGVDTADIDIVNANIDMNGTGIFNVSKITLGSAGDVLLERFAANELRLSDLFIIQRANGTDHAFVVRTGDVYPNLRVLADGTIEWGSGAGAIDVNLKRDVADVLWTDDAFAADYVTMSWAYLAVNALFERWGTGWNRKDTAKFARLIDMGIDDPPFRFQYADAGANPITWTTLVDFAKDRIQIYKEFVLNREDDGTNAGILNIVDKTTGDMWHIPFRTADNDRLWFNFYDAATATWYAVLWLMNPARETYPGLVIGGDIKLYRYEVDNLFFVGTGGKPKFTVHDGGTGGGLVQIGYGVLAAGYPSIEFGPGGASGRDVNIYRKAKDVLKTDDLVELRTVSANADVLHMPFSGEATLAFHRFTGVELGLRDVSNNIIYHRFSKGDHLIRPLDADGTTTLRDCTLTLIGKYWDGTASVERPAKIFHRMYSTTPSSELVFQIAGSDYFKIGDNGVITYRNMKPNTDNTLKVGEGTSRFAEGHFVTLYTGDITLDNGIIISEDLDGVIFKSPRGEELMKLDMEGNLYVKGEIKQWN